jgi:poly(glycerol-phosphate) alpha-glucosyltransferase
MGRPGIVVDVDAAMKVGLLTASLSRNAGGLYDATRLLARDLQQSPDCDVEVFGLEDQFTSRDIAGWAGLHTNTLRVVGPKSFGYAPGLGGLLNNARLDLLHSHGLWMYPSRASSLWAKSNKKPYVISPHGMLDAWAVNNSRWKKRLVGSLYEDAHLRGAACLHALCESELGAIRAYGLRNPVCVIPNGIDMPDSQKGTSPVWQNLLPPDARVLFYLGRIHPKKGLINLLHAWKLAQQGSADEKPWVLVIAGWDQGGHEAELKSLAASLGISSSIFFVGPQFDEAKQAGYKRADAFVLPSYSEGLPMVVLEAWAHSLPVVMTPQCNLPEGYTAQAAFKVEPNADSISDGLKTLFSQPVQERLAMGMRGQQLVKDKFTWPKIAAQMHEVYRWLLGQADQPQSVKII